LSHAVSASTAAGIRARVKRMALNSHGFHRGGQPANGRARGGFPAIDPG
jgi:hypothetical protein